MITIERWVPQAATDDELRAVHAFGLPIHHETDPDTPPQPYELWRQDVLTTTPYEDTLRWLGRDGDAIVAFGQVGLTRTGHNAHRAECYAEVAASHRRQGIARSLMRRIVDAADADARTTLGAGAPQESPGVAFLAAIGMEQAMLERRSRLHVAKLDQLLLDTWIADAKVKATDYSLLLILGRVPDEHLDGVIKVHEAMNDAPRDELDLEDEHDTPEHFRDREGRLLARGYQRMELLARHDPTGDVVGFTTLSWHPLQPEVVWQWGTAVNRDHRGHALGRWLKAANLRNLAEHNPGAAMVDTWNAGSNQWMLAINDDLGFTPYIWYPGFDGKLEAMRARLADL